MIFPIVVALNWKDKTNLEQTLVPPKTTWVAIHQPVMPGRDTSIPQVRGLWGLMQPKYDILVPFSHPKIHHPYVSTLNWI